MAIPDRRKGEECRIVIWHRESTLSYKEIRNMVP